MLPTRQRSQLSIDTYELTKSLASQDSNEGMQSQFVYTHPPLKSAAADANNEVEIAT